MKNVILLAIVTIAILFLSACSENKAETKQAHEVAKTSHNIHGFTEKVFDQLQLANKPILIDVHATWCSVCKKQSMIIDEYLAKNPHSELIVLRVDYDTQTEWVKYFKAPRQSTLVLYKGSEEFGKIIAETNRDKIFSFLNKAG